MEQYPFLPIGLCFVKRIKVPGFGGRWPIRVDIFKLGKGGRSRFRARYLATRGTRFQKKFVVDMITLLGEVRERKAWHD